MEKLPLFDKIRAKRNEKGFSQLYMGCKLGISQEQYCRIECGKRKLTVTRFIAICALLDIEPNDIVGNVPPTQD